MIHAHNAIAAALREVMEGYDEGNPASGLLGLLATATAEEASAIPGPGRHSLAGHVAHVRYGMEAARRELLGEPRLDWQGSWGPETLDAEAWADQQASLRQDYEALTRVIETGPIMVPVPRFLFVATAWGVAHAAYHFGAAQQILARSALVGS